MTADHTLAAIDGALRDYETSDDAMRWTPERAVTVRQGQQVIPASLPPAEFAYRLVESFALWGSAYLEAARPAIASVAGALNKAAAAYSHGLSLVFLDPRERRRHRRRCPACNPASYSPPQRGWYADGPKAARMRGRRR